MVKLTGKLMPKTIAYVRITVLDRLEDIEESRAAILRLAGSKGLVDVHFVEEKIYKRTPWRETKIVEIITELEPEDNILVYHLSRLGQSVFECLEVLSTAAEKGINVYSVKGDWQFALDVDRKFIIKSFSLVQEIQNEVASQRTKETLRTMKLGGVKLGRPGGKYKLDEYREEIEQLLAAGIKKNDIIKQYNVCRSTFFQWLKRRKIERLKWGE